MSLVPVDQVDLVPAARTNGHVTLGDELQLWREAAEMAKHIAGTPFVPDALRNDPAGVTAAILRANELGISALHGLSQIHIIKGRPCLAAELMRALVLGRGHELWAEEMTITRVVLCGRRSDSDHVTKITWTMDDAKRANLLGNQAWRSYPLAMLMARATGQLCRFAFADVLAGISYTREEIEDADWIDVDGSEAAAALPPAPDDAPAAAPGTTRKAAAPTAKARARKARPAQPVRRSDELPPLPGEEVEPTTTDDAPKGEPGEPDEVVLKRAQAIAMKANDASVDHHLVIAAVTNGLKSSAKAVTAEEGSQVLEALVKIRQGKLWLDTSTTTPALVDHEPTSSSGGGEPPTQADAREASPPPPAASSPPSDGDVLANLPQVAADWTADEWRAFLSDRGVKAMQVVTEAQRLAALDDEDPPGSLEDLNGRETLCELLVSYVEDAAAKTQGDG